MKIKKFLERARQLLHTYRITEGKNFQLKKFNPDDTGEFTTSEKDTAQDLLSDGQMLIGQLQEVLYAQDCWAVLLIFQGVDAAGKDGVIKHVMSAVNPQGCDVTSFKVPSAEELDHDYLWRCAKRLPERGRIGIFNRSYYEETVVVRVHPEFLQQQKLPPQLVTKQIWEQRFKEIRQFEEYLSNNGLAVRKFFLHVSQGEQQKRFLERIDNPHKNWKFSMNDVRERERWDDYMYAYEQTIRHTATEYAPWYVVPADHKWFTRLVVSAAVVECLTSLDLTYPKLGKQELKDLQSAKQALLEQRAGKKHISTSGS